MYCGGGPRTADAFDVAESTWKDCIMALHIHKFGCCWYITEGADSVDPHNEEFFANSIIYFDPLGEFQQLGYKQEKEGVRILQQV